MNTELHPISRMSVRPAERRGRTKIDWLDSFHSFSFGDYYDPNNMSFRSLRVINDDVVAPGKGFGTHPHRNMEILSIVLKGAIEHRDSLGSGEILRPGEVQVMTAGRGITHSEFNPSKEEPLHLLQVWIQPAATGLAPAYAQKPFPVAERKNVLRRVAGRRQVEDDGALLIHQAADLYLLNLDAGREVTHRVSVEQGVFVQVATGELAVAGVSLKAGDGVSFENTTEVQFLGVAPESEILVFTLD